LAGRQSVLNITLILYTPLHYVRNVAHEEQKYADTYLDNDHRRNGTMRNNDKSRSINNRTHFKTFTVYKLPTLAGNSHYINHT